MKKICLLTSVIFSIHLYSQEPAGDKLLDSKPGLIGGFSTRNTFIYGFNAPVMSIRLGVEFREKFRIGAAFCFLKQQRFGSSQNQLPFMYRRPVVTEAGMNDTVPSNLKLNYFAYFAEYVYFSKKRWEFSIPVQLGLGSLFYEYEVDGTKKRELESPVLLYEPSVSVQYKIFPWLAAGADIGYRFMLVNNKVAGHQFNSPVYDLKLMVLWKEILKGTGIMKKGDK